MTSHWGHLGQPTTWEPLVEPPSLTLHQISQDLDHHKMIHEIMATISCMMPKTHMLWTCQRGINMTTWGECHQKNGCVNLICGTGADFILFYSFFFFKGTDFILSFFKHQMFKLQIRTCVTAVKLWGPSNMNMMQIKKTLFHMQSPGHVNIS